MEGSIEVMRFGKDGDGGCTGGEVELSLISGGDVFVGGDEGSFGGGGTFEFGG